jgi:hypothetical protein
MPDMVYRNVPTPVGFNHNGLLNAFENSPHIIRNAVAAAGFEPPSLSAVQQWLRADRRLIAAAWLPLIFYVALRQRRIGWEQVFVGTRRSSSSSGNQQESTTTHAQNHDQGQAQV